MASDGSAREHERGGASAGEPALLPDLWLVCVVFGLAAAVSATLFFLATPLGKVVFGLMAAASVALALGLWVRSNAARRAAIGVSGVICALLVVDFLGEPLAAKHVLQALGACIGMTLILSLVARARYFADVSAPKPRLTTWRLALSAAPFLLLTIGAVAFAVVDEPAQEFPRLRWQAPSVPREKNAYYVLEEMLSSGPLTEDEELRTALCKRQEAPAESLALARRVVARHEELLDRVPELTRLGRYAPPVPETGWEWACGADSGRFRCRWLARLLSLQSDVFLADGESIQALGLAVQTIGLARMLSVENVSLNEWSVGHAILDMGLQQVQRVANSPDSEALWSEQGRRANAVLHASLREALAIGEWVREGFREALAAELHFNVDMLRQCRHQPAGLDGFSFVSVAALPASFRGVRLVDNALPLLKPNMTHSLMGRSFQPLLSMIEHYEPLELSTVLYAIYLPEAATVPEAPLPFLRNLAGVCNTAAVWPAVAQSVNTGVSGIAEARATRVFLALRAYHADRGQLPAELDALVPEYLEELPPDPFTHEAFIYQPHGGPPQLVSLGPDGVVNPDPEFSDDFQLELSFATR